MVFVRDVGADVVRVCVDGRLDGSRPDNTTGSLAGTQGLAIGAENNGTNAFRGQIDDFRVYNVPLNLAQAQMIYNRGRGDFALTVLGTETQTFDSA